MRPDLSNPPRIETQNSDLPLIEQIDAMYWLPHDQRMRHCFNLSRWHIEFYGELFPYEHSNPVYANYNTDIFDESSYPRYVGQGEMRKELWNAETPQITVDLARLDNTAYVHIGEKNVGVVGSIFMLVRVIKFRPKNLSGFEKLLNCSNLINYILDTEKQWKNKRERKNWVCPSTPKDIEKYYFNQRLWLHSMSGNNSARLQHNYYSALDDQHILHVGYSPHFWPLEHGPASSKALEISLHPLQDFMNNLSIEEIDPTEQDKYISGAIQANNPETLTLPGQDDASNEGDVW